jgi:eukaryotic-like serine/threonine-protein kinase
MNRRDPTRWSDGSQPADDPHRGPDTASGAASDIEGTMGRARPEETGGALLARARIAAAMFGPQAQAGFGRFRILERLGAGGMGVVHAAYDPDLDRGVALKLVHVAARDRDTALVEAKALARLAHPNVVPIYDVGIEGDHVYLVMELVRGRTLHRWAAGRRWRDVLEAYRQAGAALAAAHRAGLVHRDFKPENAIVGADRRVRVVDFGLACEVQDPAQGEPREPRIVGTPRYMAPEQAAGAAATPAADQYSFCVALDEALAEIADPPVPRRLAAAIQRGRTADPAARFASMTELLRALARDPARTRRHRAAAGALALSVGAIAFAAGRRAQVAPEEPCTGAGADLAAVWSPASRTSALARLDSLGDYGRAVRATISPKLDDAAARWVTGRRAACLDHQRGAQSDTLFDLRTACLERGLAALATVRDLVTGIQADKLADLPRAVQVLPDPSACSDAAALLSPVKPPAPAIATRVDALDRRLAQARVLLGAGRSVEARTAAVSVVEQARALAYDPLIAAARLVEGHAAMSGDRRTAVPILVEAQDLAIATGADALAVEAWARRAWVQGTSTDPAGALAGLDVITALARRAAVGAFPRALLHNNVGGVELARGQRERARTAFETALAHATGATGPGTLELVNIRGNLALVIDDRSRADQLLREAIANLTDRLGADHPDTLDLQWLRMGTLDPAPAALAFLEPLCRSCELHPALPDPIVECWAEAGFLALELDDRPRAVAALERAARWRPGGAHPRDAGYAALARGDARAAIDRFQDGLRDWQQRPSDAWWRRLTRAELRLGLGRAQRALALPGARHTLEASLAELEDIVRDHPGAAYERRLHRARVELAAVRPSQR